MDIISKPDFSSGKRFFGSIRFKLFVLCAVAAGVAISLMLYFFQTHALDTVSKTKQLELMTAATEYSSSLSLRGLTPEALSFPARSNETPEALRVLITDKDLRVISDSFGDKEILGKTIFLPVAFDAVSGTASFSVDTTSSFFESSAAVPILRNGDIIGTVCVFDADKEIIESFKKLGLLSVLLSVFILFVFLSVGFTISFFLNARISTLVQSIRETRHDDSVDKITISTADELSPIIYEFNDIYEKLTYVQQMRRAFVSDASHELRTPLTAIRLLCDSVAQIDNIDIETMREFMDDIVLEVDRMSHTAEKLLVLSRLDNGMANPSEKVLAPISLSEIVRTVIKNSEPIAEAKLVTLESYLEEDCTILGDTEGANQIIGNLIDNAIKYNKTGGTVRIFLFAKNGQCTFITDDTGIGIPEEHRENIFNRFFRVDKARYHDGRGGSGLGLAIVKRNVESFGGRISVSDSAFGGTRFTVTFPSLLSEEGYLC